MVTKADKARIDRAIKELWLRNIQNDYFNLHLLNEDTLKNSLYFHLRRKLGTNFLEDRSIRIYTEYNDESLFYTGKRADMAIVELNPKSKSEAFRDHIRSIIAVIELKFGNYRTSDSWFYSDITKVKDFIKLWNIDCLYYLGFISEKIYENPYWLDGRQTNNWADKKVTVLSANLDTDEEMRFHIQSCNGLNKDLDDVL